MGSTVYIVVVFVFVGVEFGEALCESGLESDFWNPGFFGCFTFLECVSQGFDAVIKEDVDILDVEGFKLDECVGEESDFVEIVVDELFGEFVTVVEETPDLLVDGLRGALGVISGV